MHHIPGMLRSLSNALDTFNVVKALPIVDETRRYVPSSATSTQSYLSVDDQIQFQRFEECLQRVQAENRAQTENNEPFLSWNNKLKRNSGFTGSSQEEPESHRRKPVIKQMTTCSVGNFYLNSLFTIQNLKQTLG